MIRKANVLIKQWAQREIMKCKQDYPNTQTSFVHPVTYIFYTFEKQRDTISPALLSGIGAPLGKKFMKWFRR